MGDFVLKNNYFELNGHIKLQVSGISIETKFIPTCVCLFLEQVQTDFLKTRKKCAVLLN